METRTYGNQNIWKLEHMETRTYGNKNIWKLEHMETRTYGNKNIWKLEHMETRAYENQNIWTLGNMETRTYGNQGMWKLGYQQIEAEQLSTEMLQGSNLTFRRDGQCTPHHVDTLLYCNGMVRREWEVLFIEMVWCAGNEKR